MIEEVDDFLDDDFVVVSNRTPSRLRTGGEIIGDVLITCDGTTVDRTDLDTFTDFLSGEA